MAIVNMSGYFQPLSNESGKTLPSSIDRAPSSTSDLKAVSQASNLKAVNNEDTATASVKQQPADTSNNEPIKDPQEFNQNIDRSLQFKVDDELGVTIVRVVDKETDELIRQFPPEELINLSRRLKELNEQDLGNSDLTAKSGILLQEKV